MKRRRFLLAPLAATVAALGRAQSDDGVKALFQEAIDDLTQRKTGAFWLLFDPAMPGYKEMRKQTQALLDGFDVTATVEFPAIDGAGDSRSVTMNWELEMVSRTGERSHTTRRAAVQCRVERRERKWRIVSFAPASLFAPPEVNGAWVALADAAAALAHTSLTFNDQAAGEGHGNVIEFLAIFDRSMPGYEDFRANVTALARAFQVNSEVELTANEGDDTARTLTLDWNLSLISPVSDVSSVERHQTVTCKMRKLKGKWRAVELQPLSFFAMPKA